MSRPLAGGAAGYVFLLVAAFASVPVAAPGCRAPRDPDLERRIEEARLGGSPAPSAGAKDRRRSKRKEESDDDEERRAYSEAEIAEILKAVPGEGPKIRALFRTGLGTIGCTLAHEAAPNTVANFVALALGLRKWRDPDTGEEMSTRFYDGLTFHRAIADFIVQTGRAGVRSSGPGWRLRREPGLVLPDPWTEAGVLAAVDAGGDTHGSQFFVSLRPSRNLAGKYTPFGRCDEGLDVARRIAAGEKHPPEDGGKSATRPKDPVRIEKVEVLRVAD